MVFCPQINGECKLQECRTWWPEENVCMDAIGRIESIKLTRMYMAAHDLNMKQLQGHVEMAERFKDKDARDKIFSRFTLEMFQRVPDLTEEELAIVQEAYRADSADEAERLLRQAGLLGGTDPV